MPQATVIRNEAAGSGRRLLTLDAVLPSYQTPGQFVTAELPNRKPAFFAIASSPGEAVQLLVKQSGDTAEAVGSLRPGDAIELSDALGNGFPIERTGDRELVILCNGAAISACRPVLRAELDRGLSRPVHFYYGVFRLSDRSFTDELAAWEEAGVNVRTVLDTGTPEWQGPTGHVQDVAEADGRFRPEISALLVGYPAMIEQAREKLLAAGVPEDQVLVNY